MISRLTWRYLVYVTNMLYYLGGSTFRFQKYKSVHNFKILVNRSRFRTLFSILAFCVNVLYLIFLVYRIIFRRFYHDPHNPFTFNFTMQMIYFLVSYTVPSSFQIEMFLRGDFIPVFVKHYIKFFRYTNNHNQLMSSNVKVNKFMTAILIVGHLVNLENIILLFLHPHKPQFLTSVLVDPLSKPIYERLPFIILQIWVWLNTWANIYFYAFHIHVYTRCGLSLLREIK